jgi:hypothetical protein
MYHGDAALIRTLATVSESETVIDDIVAAILWDSNALVCLPIDFSGI